MSASHCTHEREREREAPGCYTGKEITTRTELELEKHTCKGFVDRFPKKILCVVLLVLVSTGMMCATLLCAGWACFGVHGG